MSGSGKHMKEGRPVLFRKKRRGDREARARLSLRQKLILSLRVLAVLLFCFLMITPLRSCNPARKGYVGESAAQTIAYGNAGIIAANVDDVSSDLVRVDGRYCYKVDFATESSSYSYIIDAASGNIIASSKKAAD